MFLKTTLRSIIAILAARPRNSHNCTPSPLSHNSHKTKSLLVSTLNTRLEQIRYALRLHKKTFNSMRNDMAQKSMVSHIGTHSPKTGTQNLTGGVAPCPTGAVELLCLPRQQQHAWTCVAHWRTQASVSQVHNDKKRRFGAHA